MKKLLLISLLFTGACSQWGNDPASQFASVTYDENYYIERAKSQILACQANPKFCEQGQFRQMN